MVGGWVAGWVAGWVLKLKLMLTQPPTELELELELSLAKYVNSAQSMPKLFGQGWDMRGRGRWRGAQICFGWGACLDWLGLPY